MPESYLFSEVGRRLNEYKRKNPGTEVIRMDIGDVSLPLPEVCLNAMREAVDEMGSSDKFHGYGPEQGYAFLRQAIARNDYLQRGIKTITEDDIFISDGAKSDLGNIGDLFSNDIKVAVCNPGYPVYVDANAIDGRAGIIADSRWRDINYLDCRPENSFEVTLPKNEVDVIYLCSPCNPTGEAMTRSNMKDIVDYALTHKSLIIFDSAYEAFISDPDIPRSIYEIDGAEKCAVEIRSFSKTAGFTGVRCGYTVVPGSLEYPDSDGKIISLRKFWLRRQTTKFNGVGYIVQRAAQSLFTENGQKAIKENIRYYMNNVNMLRDALLTKGYEVYGGVNSPYVWFRSRKYMDSWEMFDRFLEGPHLSSTPGIGFGSAGDGFLRLTGFNSVENTAEAAKRILAL